MLYVERGRVLGEVERSKHIHTYTLGVSRQGGGAHSVIGMKGENCVADGGRKQRIRNMLFKASYLFFWSIVGRQDWGGMLPVRCVRLESSERKRPKDEVERVGIERGREKESSDDQVSIFFFWGGGLFHQYVKA